MLSCLENAYSHALFSAGTFTCKVGQTDLVIVVPSGLLLGLCMRDYKSLCVVVMICVTLVNIQTDSILISLYDKLSQLSQKLVNRSRETVPGSMMQ